MSQSGPEPTRAANEVDAFLRDHGFRIHQRPANGPPVWWRKGRLYSHVEAVGVAQRERREALAALEEATR